MASEAVPRLGYRPALDGLRGVAVLAVIVHHARPALLPGGFLGVDVFFVLSGFLITTLLLEEHERAGRISLRQFYRRRALRLLPALAVVLASCLVVGMFVAGPEADLTRRAVLPVALFVANWAEAFGADLGGLGHMWSLAIEEQFYVVWPLLLVGLLTLRDGHWRALRVALALALTVVLVRAIALHGGVPGPRLYAGLDTRADGVLIGCALALARALGVVPRVLASRAAAAAGIAILAVLALTWQPANVHIGFLAGGLAAAALVARVVDRPEDAMTAWLASGRLVWVGRLSYGLYLWHWPIFYFLKVQDFPGRIGLAIVSSFGAAMLSARFVERPVLELNRRRAVGAPTTTPGSVPEAPTELAA